MTRPDPTPAPTAAGDHDPMRRFTVHAAQLRVRPAARYGASVLLAALATLVTAGLSRVVETYTVNVYVIAIVLSAWYGGLGPGLLATALSAAALDYFFVPPYFQFWPLRTSDAVRVTLFVMSGTTISWMSHLLRSAVRDVAQGLEQVESGATLFRHTFEQAAVGLAHVGLDGRWLRLNARLAEIVGYTPDALLALTFQDITHPDDLRTDLEQVRALLRGDATRYAMDKRYVRADGSMVWIRLTASLVRDAEGAPDYFISVVEDIDARVRAEAERARLGVMLGHITDGVVVFEGADLTIRYLNAEAERLLRRPAVDCLGRTLLDLDPDLVHTDAYRAPRRTVLEQVPVQYEEFYSTHAAWYDVRAYPTNDAAGPGALVLFRDVTSQRETAIRLEEARLQAEAGSRAKSNFLAAMSHEIRTPIHAMSGYVELLELGLAGPLTEQQRGYLERTRLAGRTLLALVNDVLDLARVESGKTDVVRQLAWVAPTTQAAVDLLLPQALAKGVTVVNACGDDVRYWGDETRLSQILTNLIGNAIKFTPSGGRITILCGSTDRTPAERVDLADDTDGAWTLIRVQDTGIGIASDALERVFEAFAQIEDGLTRSHGGTGLGLTISRHLARLMGGDVRVESVAGEGTSFLLYLPAPAADVVGPAAASAGGERRRGTRTTRGLHVIGETVLREIERIVAATANRLRRDPLTPSAHSLGTAHLDDHTASFLADIAQTLVIVEAAEGRPSDMLRDSSAIQRMVAERHGAFRARLGWHTSELVQEFVILREEIDAAVQRHVAHLAPAAPIEEAMVLVRGLADHAERASLTGYREVMSRRTESAAAAGDRGTS